MVENLKAFITNIFKLNSKPESIRIEFYQRLRVQTELDKKCSRIFSNVIEFITTLRKKGGFLWMSNF
jgi:predicted neuraminidase